LTRRIDKSLASINISSLKSFQSVAEDFGL
jgi:hypothetical protein